MTFWLVAEKWSSDEQLYSVSGLLQKLETRGVETVLELNDILISLIGNGININILKELESLELRFRVNLSTPLNLCFL